MMIRRSIGVVSTLVNVLTIVGLVLDDYKRREADRHDALSYWKHQNTSAHQSLGFGETRCRPNCKSRLTPYAIQANPANRSVAILRGHLCRSWSLLTKDLKIDLLLSQFYNGLLKPLPVFPSHSVTGNVLI